MNNWQWGSESGGSVKSGWDRGSDNRSIELLQLKSATQRCLIVAMTLVTKKWEIRN